MLFSLLLVIPSLVWGQGTQFSFPNFEITDRFTIPINQCFENVTRDEFGDFSSGGSTYCMCTEGDTITDSGFSCFYYDEVGCTGNVIEEHWGGCDSGTQTITTVENCQTAQDYLADDGDCPYWIRDHTVTNSIMQQAIYPLDTCFDYWCNDVNNNENSRSCKMDCEDGTNDITQIENSDYKCQDLEDNTCMFCDGDNISNKVCGSTSNPTCSVTVTQYQVGDANFECGSKSGKNNFKTSKKSLKSNYIMLDNDDTPYPIGQCAQVRNGYYSYSYQYLCNEAGDEVELYHYLNNDASCKDTDNRYLIETYVSSNTSFRCDLSKSSGKIGYYESCSNYNWDAKYYEYLTLFGECVPLKNNPLTLATFPTNDGNTEAVQPWYENVRVVMSCNLNERGKTYPSVYLYVTADCTGDYLFRWDWDDYYSELPDYGIQDCSIPQIKGCSNGQDGVRRGNLPVKESVC